METNIQRETIQFTKIRDVKSPNRANAHDAGTDFYVPKYSEKFAKDLMDKNEVNKLAYQMAIDEQGDEVLEIIIPAGEQVNIPSGIRVNILDKSSFLQANNKSGIASKYHLVVGASIIDADYQGEMHINLINVGNTTVTIQTGMKVVQFIHQHFINTDWVEIPNYDYDNLEKTDRGTGGFSSSGLK